MLVISILRRCAIAFLLLALVFQSAAAAEVPDTLDLAQHARFAVNALTGTSDERGEFMFNCAIVPPKIEHDPYSFSACGPKYIESMAMTSLMTGIGLDESHSRRCVDYLVSCIEDDGMFYCKIGPDRPWDKSSPEDWANIYGQGRLLRAMLAMHQLEGNDVWVDRMQRLTHMLEKIAVRKTDPKSGEAYAYFPTSPGYGDIFSYPKSGWKTTELETKVDKSKMGKQFADLPDHSFGIPLYIGGIVEPLVRYATLHDDPDAMKLAGEIVRFVMQKESGWMPDGYPQGVVPEQNAQYYGHFHGHTLALRGILEYGIATNNQELKNFARAGYEYSRTFGIPRIGWFDEYTGKASHETCGLVNMTALAIKLSLSGVGDYWDDVDGYARNQLTEAQFTSLDRLRAANKGKELSPEQEEKLTRLVGTFGGWGLPNSVEDTRIMNCCTANGSEGLYYIWDSIVRTQGDTTYVNLLLNRRSPQVDVASYLPYRGEVDLSVKKAGCLAVRVPGWVEKTAVKISRNEKAVTPVFVGNYAVLDELAAGDAVKLVFPIHDSVESYAVDSYEFRGTKYLGRRTFRFKFRGNTAVDIEPKAESGYAIYDRDYLTKENPPMVPLAPYVATTRIDW